MRLFASKTNYSLSIVAALALSAFAGQAGASFNMVVVQNGNNVTASGNGSIDLDALSGPVTTLSFPQTIPGGADLILGPAAVANVDTYIGFTGPASFGTKQTTVFANSGTGVAVGIFFPASEIVLPQGYVSGTQLNASATWNNVTIADLGFTPGTYVYTWGSGATADSLTVNIATPEPGTALTSLAALGGLLMIRRLRRPAPLSSQRDGQSAPKA